MYDKPTCPEQYRNYNIGAGAVLSTDGGGEVPQEEREPAQEEGPHHNTQGYKGFMLFPPVGRASDLRTCKQGR